MKIIVSTLIICLFFNCKAVKNKSSSNNEMIVKIASQRVDCMGFVMQKCLQIKLQNQENWRPLFENIEGFNFTEGYKYTLKVRKETIKNPPADASSLKYVLLEIISKEKKQN